MSMIQAIRDYLCTCPHLKDGKMNVDYLGAEPTEYVVESVPSSGIIKRYTDGGTLRQYLFIFGSREYFSDKVLKQLSNSGFYEDFARWIETQSDAGNLPKLPEGMSAQRMEVVSTAYMLDATEKNARYQIQCRFVYYERSM